MNERPIINEVAVYGRAECRDAQSARAVLEGQGVDYRWHDVDADPDEFLEAMRINGGQTRVPTVVIPPAVVLVEPTSDELTLAIRTQLGHRAADA